MNMGGITTIGLDPCHPTIYNACGKYPPHQVYHMRSQPLYCIKRYDDII
jgi:hypothetical protein